MVKIMIDSEEKKPEHEPKITSIATIIATLAGLLIIIFTAQKNLSPKFFYLSTSFLIFAIVSFSFYISFSTTINRVQKILVKKIQKKIISINFEDFRYYVEKFEEFSDVYGRDNIATVLYDLEIAGNPNKTVRNILIEKSIFASLFDLYKIFREKLNSKQKNTNFKSLVTDFDAILAFYNRLLCTCVEKVREIAAGQNFTNSKENYRERRERYVSYITKYIEFSEKMNQKTGEKFFRTYFDLPRDL